MSKQAVRFTDSNGNIVLPECAESGSNYIKLADGTLICYGKKITTQTLTSDTTHFGAQAYLSQDTVYYPMTFISIPTVYAWVNIGSGYTFAPWISPSEDRVTVNGMSYYVSGTKTVTVHYIAIGRWK